MNIDDKYIASLLYRALSSEEELSPEENEQLKIWLEKDTANLSLYQQLQQDEYIRSALVTHSPEKIKELRQSLYSAITKGAGLTLPLDEPGSASSAKVKSMRPFWKRPVAAAAVILAVLHTAGFLIYQSIKSSSGSIGDPMIEVYSDIPPGKEGAILILSDGSQLVLDDLNDGTITIEDGSKLQLRRGQLTYSAHQNTVDPGKHPQAVDIAYHTLTTPKGRQFDLILPDGSHVWLNAASSIKFPVTMEGKDKRDIFLTGEAYIEVVKDTRPFVVATRYQQIQVLGTHFNVNAYADEALEKTTLLEGSVRVQAGTGLTEMITLKPGQQALISSGSPPSLNTSVEVSKVMAWKNGYFNFDGMELKDAMKQLERWYDIRVVYEGDKVPDMEFGGELSRKTSFSALLKILQDVGIKYAMDIKEKTLIIKN